MSGTTQPVVAKLAPESTFSTVSERLRAPNWSQVSLGLSPGSVSHLLWGFQLMPQFPLLRERKNVMSRQLPEKEAQTAFNKRKDAPLYS